VPGDGSRNAPRARELVVLALLVAMAGVPMLVGPDASGDVLRSLRILEMALSVLLAGSLLHELASRGQERVPVSGWVLSSLRPVTGRGVETRETVVIPSRLGEDGADSVRGSTPSDGSSGVPLEQPTRQASHRCVVAGDADDARAAPDLAARTDAIVSARPLRVCVVGSGTAFLSGISYYTHCLAGVLAERHPTSVILMRRLLPPRLYPGRERVGVCLAELSYGRPAADVFDGVDWFWGRSMLRALRFLRRHRPEVIVLQWWTATVLHSYLLVALAGRRAGARIVLEYHETQDTGEAARPLAARYAGLLMPWLRTLSDAFVVHSSHDRRILQEEHPRDARPVAVITHGPYDQYVARARPASPSEAINVLFFGTIRPYKGLEDLLRAYAMLDTGEAARYRLTVVGETWEGWTAPLDLLAIHPHRDRITLVNRYVHDNDVGAFFAEADAVALPYRRASASGPLHIAMSHGLPVIVTNVGGLPDAFAGYDGALVVEPEDPRALAGALRRLRDLRGRRFHPPGSWQTTADALGELFDKLVARPPPTTRPIVRARHSATLGRDRRPRARGVASRGVPTVSVVVCATDRERWADLVEAMQSVERQSVRPLEVVAVIDHNAWLLERARRELSHVLVLPNEAQRGASGARNTGARATRGDIVAFLDDDAVARPDWLATLLPHYIQADVIGVGGRIVPRWLGGIPRWLPEEFKWVVGATYRGAPVDASAVRNVWTGSMTIRRTAFERAGGFLVGFGKVGKHWRPEDTELCIRAARAWPDGEWIYEPASVVEHKVAPERSTPLFFMRRCYAEGVGKAHFALHSEAGALLTTERAYVVDALPRGFVSGFADVVVEKDLSGLARSGAIVGGLACASVGHVAGLVQQRKARRSHTALELGSRKTPVLAGTGRAEPYA
jgi:glycosyltransferase involved in cell wall biosynthesis/GT2 family glycosyltransferase